MVSNRQNQKREEAKRLLRQIETRFDRSALDSDPVRYVHLYQSREDREVVALLSALLAFGNVKSIHASISKVLAVVGASPLAFVKDFRADRRRREFQTLGHRWVKGDDLVRLFDLMKSLTERHGGLREAFLTHHRTSDPHIGPLLERFADGVFSQFHKPSLSRGFRYFFPSPADGSPCKRLCMFFRWMVRPSDGIDLGLWSEIEPSQLVIPLDTHVWQFARRFRLTPYKNPRWESAVQVTEFLKEMNPNDPTRYDFSICHYGMDEGW